MPAPWTKLLTKKQFQLTRNGLDDLQRTDAPEPRPGPRDVLVRWHAWSLNYRDLMLVEVEDTRDVPLPFTPLSDAAGEVVAVRAEVTAWKPCDRVVSHYFIDWQEGPGAQCASGFGRKLISTLKGASINRD